MHSREKLGRQRAGLRARVPFPAARQAPAPSTCSGRIISPASPSTTCWAIISPPGEPQAILNIGPNAEGQSSNTGMFQNRLAPSGNAIWMLGKHTLSFGASYTYTQLNTIDKRTGNGHHCDRRLQPDGAGLRKPRQFGNRLLRHLVPARQCQPLLPRQPARHLSAGQVADHAEPFADRGRAL